MKTPHLFTLAAALLISFSSLAGAKTPDLVGKWVSEYSVHTHQGMGTSNQTIEITKQYSEGFIGVRKWAVKNVKDGAPTKVTKATVAFAGVIGFDEKTLYFADHGQSSHMSAKMVGPDKMQVIFLKSGEPAVAFRAVFERVKK